MNVEKVERRLKKIITVFDAFKEDGKISSIEKDLLLGYIRELYEIVQESGAQQIPSSSSKMEAQMEHHANSVAKDEFPKEVSLPKEEISVLTVISPAISSHPESLLPHSEVLIEEAKPISSTTVIGSPKTQIDEEEIIYNSPLITNENMEKLFIITKAVDLSDKLAMSHIEDINKAMGINERLYNQNELFGGNGQLFLETIKHLNQLSDFGEAKNYLQNGVASEFKWDTDNKWSKAQQFIRLVYRKYN